jgi:phosphatidate cytidylyltransferase
VVNPFWSRIIVGAALLPIVLWLVWLGGWWLFALALLGGILALHELYVIARGLRPLVLGGYAGLLLVLLGAELGGPPWLVAGIGGTFVLSFLVFGISDARPSFTGAMGTTMLGVVWVAGGLAALVLVRDAERGRLALLTVLIAVWADDTAAYFVGRLIGRHRMAPTLSPKKSWEGFVAGTAAAVAVAFFALYQDRDTYLSIWQAVVLGAAIAMAAVLGDLFESAVKRDVAVKDSGRLLGGHGGFLDRLDSLLFAAPTAYAVVLALGHA